MRKAPQNGKKKEKPLTPRDIMKYEITEELGLMDKVNAGGWKSLTARESGRIGGILAKKEKEMKRAGLDVNSLRVEEIKLE